MHLRVPIKISRVVTGLAFSGLIAAPLAAGTPLAQAATGADRSVATVTPAVSAAPVATTVSLTPGPNPSVYRQIGAIKATVSPVTPLGPVPTGTVTFTVDAVAQTPVALVNGVARLQLATLSVGTHTITGTYSGDSTYAGSVSAPLPQTVTKANTTAALATPVEPAVYHQWGAVRATVKPAAPSSGTPSGTLKFTVDGVVGPAVTLAGGVATLKLSALSAGAHIIRAAYSGDASYNSSVSDPLTVTIVKAATAVTLGSSINPSLYDQWGSVRAIVKAVLPSASTGTGTPSGTVKFTVDGVVGAPVKLDKGVARLQLIGLAVGSHTITAAYTGDAGYSGSVSAPLTQAVTKAATAVSLTSPADPVTLFQSGSIRAKVVAVLPASGTPAGTVKFTVDGVVGAPVALSSGVARLPLANLTKGTHTIVATYSGDASYVGSVSAPFTQTIN